MTNARIDGMNGRKSFERDVLNEINESSHEDLLSEGSRGRGGGASVGCR